MSDNEIINPKEFEMTIELEDEKKLSDAPQTQSPAVNDKPQTTVPEEKRESKSQNSNQKNDIRLPTGAPVILHPKFTNDARTLVQAVVQSPMDEREVNMMEGDINDKRSPFIRDVFMQYTKEQIEENTQRAIKIQELQRKNHQDAQEEEKKEMRREQAFRAKSAVLGIDLVKNAPNTDVVRTLKKRLRTSNDELEITAFGAAIIYETVRHQHESESK